MKKIVYLIESNKTNRTQLKNYLLSIFGNSFEIKEFKDFEACMFHNQIPDLIIANQTLDAQKAMHLFKSMFNDIEFIFFTSQDSISDAIGLIENGAFDYIISNSNTEDEIEYTSLEILKKSILQLFSKTIQYLSPTQIHQTMYFQ